MKKILIIGSSSYIGNSFKEWLKNWGKSYEVEKISVRNENWKAKSFKEYDVVFYVAGIAHTKETKKNKDLYFKVNRDLLYEIALKSKSENVHHFIFLSSMSVYGIEKGKITERTYPNPKNSYGLSKFLGEKKIASLEDEKFKIAIVRPPMVYGEECKGNYQKLRKLALNSPIFPCKKNKRSMIYIKNLCEHIRFLIDEEYVGVTSPQNKEYICTSEMVKSIAEINGKKIKLTKIFNPIIQILNIKIINKLFGDLYYEKNFFNEDNTEQYHFYETKESIRETEIAHEKDSYIIE